MCSFHLSFLPPLLSCARQLWQPLLNAQLGRRILPQSSVPRSCPCPPEASSPGSWQLEFPFLPALLPPLPPRSLPLAVTHPGDDLGFAPTASARFGFSEVSFQSSAAGIKPHTSYLVSQASRESELREEKKKWKSLRFVCLPAAEA